jgi:hypothetical protein
MLGHADFAACMRGMNAGCEKSLEPPLIGLRTVGLEGRVENRTGDAEYAGVAWSEEELDPGWWNALSLLVWVVAGVVALVPFAFDTSPWDAVTLRVPGNQGNWWHVLVGAPFFLAYPMIWLRLRSLFSARVLTRMGRRLIWGIYAISIGGTILVETPFLLHLAGTSAWQRLSVLSLGLGIVIASAAILFLRRHHIVPARACLAGIDTAYLANAALCLVVYSDATGPLWSRVGWLMSMVLVWPIALELVWLFVESFRGPRVRAA